jgi:hypothetical protein
MISTVLYEAKGVITEDRFQQMNDIQWLFQYHVIMQHKDEEFQIQRDIVSKLVNTIEIAGVFSHPDVNVRGILDTLRSDGKTADDFAKEAEEFVKENEDKFPENIPVVLDIKPKATVKKGRIDKNLGIITTES